MAFIKSFGLGILYFLLSPIILACCILIGIFNVLNFTVQFFIMVVNFFSGKKLFPTFKKDLEAVKLLKNMQDPTKPAEPTQPAQTFIQQNFYASPNGQFPNVPFPQQQIPNNNPFQQIPTNNEQPKMVIENKEESSND